MRNRNGFTFIELLIVVAIIGVLSGIAIPKFSLLIAKGIEASTRGNLGALRSALSIYYSDTEGKYPADTLTSLTTKSKYLTLIPVAKYPFVPKRTPGHRDSSKVTAQTAPSDAGGWSYDNKVSDSNFGRILANCTHSDSRGTKWTTY